MNDLRPNVSDAVAIIAMSGRFPGAPDVETLWRNVSDGVESISRFSPVELFRGGVEPKLIENPSYVPVAAVLSGIDQFDAQFFHFTAREAECTDPQHRLLLECAWETLEQAGYLGQGSEVRTGVYVGAGPSNYWANNLAPNLELISSIDEVQLLVGNGSDFAATRISYKLNLTGPSLTVGTACSTSLVAVHLACTSLLDFHCDIALAGGVSIQGPTCKGYIYQEGGIMSPDGRCRPFDAKAAGTVAGSGVAMVALRRLEDALKAGDTIHAVILGSAVNNDGLGKAGFTAPSEKGQAAVIAEALAIANISPDSIGYVEAHGTGTPLGDPIEVAALTRVFRRDTARCQFCALGSVKSNFGHLDAAAGVTGLIKTVLALQHHTLPPTVHFENPNPKLNLENSPFFISNTARDWVADSPRRAGVSSFGIGGTNAHVVLQEAPPQESGPTLRSTCLLVLSAKTRGALEMLRRNLGRHLERQKDLNLADVSFTLAVGRRTFPERCAVVCNSRDEAIAKLRLALPAADDTPRSDARVAFFFSAEHPLRVQSILELYASEPAFREAIDACTSILRHRLGLGPSELLSLTNAPAAASSTGLHETTHVLAESFSLKYAVSILLRSWGIEPCAMIGGSLGEYVAAVLSGIFSLADALALVNARAHLMRSVPGPDKQGTQKLSSFRQTPYTPHPVPPAVMSDAAEEFLRKAELHAPRIPFLSILTGDWITPAQATDPGYWIRHLQEWTPSADTRKCLRDLSDVLWLEIGAGDVSITSSEWHSAFAEPRRILPTSDSLNPTDRGYAGVLSTLGELWTLGAAVDWNSFFKFEQRRRVPLPTYPFERQRYWIDPPAPVRDHRPEGPPEVVKASPSPIDSWFYAPRWTQTAKPTSLRLREATWILVADSLGLADAVAMLLRQAGAQVAMIRNGDVYSQSGSDLFVFPLKDPGAHTKMWNALDRLAWSESNILFFELAKPQRPDSWNMRSESALAGTLRLLALVQGLSLSGAPRRLAVITNNTQTVNCEEACRPEIATLWGALRVVAKEYPNLRCQAFDLDWSDFEEGSMAQVAGDLLAGLAYPAPNLALRAGTLWEQRVEAAQLTEAKRLRIRERGTYLITGGLGSMGMAFAEYLARTAHARLALITRTGLSSPYDETSSDKTTSKADGETRFPLLSDINAIEEFERAAGCEANLLSLSSNPGLERLLNRCCSALAWQFVCVGFTSLHPGARTSLQQIQNRLGILPKFQKLFELLVRWLAEDGIVAQVGSEIEVTELPCPDDLLSELAARFPQFIPLTDLISHCTRSYARALSGEIPALTVLYPDGTSRWLDAATADIPHHSSDPVYLRVAADLVAHLVEARTDPIRILEIGGGTGDLTSRLVELIGNGKVEYHFTDISLAFVSQARDKAAKRGLRDARFARFDISQPPEPQGFEPSSYDLVLGYNVIHATPDLVQTTNYLRSLLSEGGGLVLVESVKAPRWIDMIWGLTDGWWLFTDRQRRQWSPLVSLEEWEKVLAESGFSRAISYPRDPGARQQVTAGLIIGIASTPAGPVPANGFAEPGRSRERIARVRQRLNQMEAEGAEVRVITTDISNPDEVARAVEATETTLGPIQGVIHTAGVLGQTLIHDQQPADVRQVLAPKVDGTICLSSVLGNRPLDFFILCSSLSAVEPIPGQFAYSAANAFLDSFAQFRAARSTGLTVSVDWGFWQELGMIETARVSQSVKQALLQEIHSSGWSQRGVEIFARILQSSAPPQLLVSPRPLRDLSSAPDTGKVLNHPVLHKCARKSAQLVVSSGTIVAGRTWLVDEHHVAGHPVLPGTAYLDLALTAFWHLHGRCPVELSDVFFLAPMNFAEGESKEVELILQGDPEGSEFRVVAQLSDGTWQEHARGGIQMARSGIAPEKIDLEAIERDLVNQADAISEDLGAFWKRVETFTPHWRNVVSVACGGKQGAGRFSLPPHLTDDLSEFALHPALLDTATGFLAFRREFDAFLPFSFGYVCVFDRLPSNCASVFRIVFTEENLVLAGSVVDSTGNEIIRIGEYILRLAVPPAAAGKAAPRVTAPVPENVRLEIDSPGHLQTLLYRPAPRLSPHSGEVEIEVRAAGLNFVEVLYALGMLPSLGGNGFVALGQECAGVVTRVGGSVHSLEPGQEVYGYGPACFSLYTRLRTSAVALKPPSLSFEEAAGLPAAYLTAWYGLIHLARLRPDERVLIHAAAGGVGLAAVRIAQWRGAEIFATAGSPHKREFLQRMGVPHVMDSRSLLFADQIRQMTKGDGIDVVLNCLSGDFIPKSLELLRRHGRFVELGKRDILRNTPLGLGTFANYISFFAVDMGLDVPGFSDLWREVATHLQSGALGALSHRTFDAAQVQEAFEYMAQARHIGKVILSFADVQAVRSAASMESRGLSVDGMSRPAEEVMLFGNRQAVASFPSVAAPGPQIVKHERPCLPSKFRAPESAAQRIIASVWEELLGVAPIGVEDDFFELNGDSLLAAQVMSRLQQLFEIKVPISLIFGHPTIQELAEQITSRRTSSVADTQSLDSTHEEGAV
jgi:acyl transferase domain-containing protein/NAD(P)-dependent dehydrogenase (short-subunit alcohol dehydrogenase family)/acyl carrier protein